MTEKPGQTEHEAAVPLTKLTLELHKLLCHANRECVARANIRFEQAAALIAADRAEAVRVAVEREREACARVAEEHMEHVDFDIFSAREQPGGKVQSHEEAPFICNVAEAIRHRAEGDATPGPEPLNLKRRPRVIQPMGNCCDDSADDE